MPIYKFTNSSAIANLTDNFYWSRFGSEIAPWRVLTQKALHDLTNEQLFPSSFLDLLETASS